MVLAELLAEDQRPPSDFWLEPIISSRLVEYECFTRLFALNASVDVRERATEVLEGLELLELSPLVLRRALTPFPKAVRTLDALHLATACFLQDLGKTVRFASYDRRQRRTAESLGMTLILDEPVETET